MRSPVTAVMLAVILVGGSTASATADTEVFGPPGGDHPLGWAAFHVGAGDFDADGTTDLVVPNSLDDNVSVFMGDARGGFRDRKPIPTAEHPLEPAVGDFDEDGLDDVAIAGSGSLRILISTGSGRFEQSIIDLAPASLQSVVAADLNLDGHLDLAAASKRWITVKVLFGLGDGTFQRQPDLAWPNNNGIPIGIEAADFDGDGDSDVVATDRYFTDIVLFRNQGDGTFPVGERVDLVVGTLNNIAVGDFDEDGDLDMATEGNAYRDQVSLLIGNGDGTFEHSYVQLDNQTNAVALTVSAGDFNGDCHLDLATADGATGEMPSIGVLLGAGDGTFDNVQTFEAGSRPHFMAAGDFNADGADDLAIPNAGANFVGTLSIALSRGATGCA